MRYSNLRSIESCDNLNNKVVFVRVDYNVPVNEDGHILDNHRIIQSLKTVLYLLKKGSKVVLLSHFGRPKGFDENFSLKNVIFQELQNVLFEHKFKVYFSIFDDLKNHLTKVTNSSVTLLENLRFYKEETLNDDNYSQKFASLGDIYVNDAFSCCHRNHSSIIGLPKYLDSYAGLLLMDEVNNLNKILYGNFKKICLIIGGSKISSKMDILSCSNNISNIILGGAVANTILHHKGYNVQKSLIENDLDVKFNLTDEKLILPQDCVTSADINSDYAYVSDIMSITENHMILDLGPASIIQIENILDESDCVIWSGPIGFYENKKYSHSTFRIAEKIFNLTNKGSIYSVIGGGDTLNAVKNYANGFSYTSTAGSAFLQWFKGKGLVGLDAINK
ncbi:phosphoglycerate kinase [Anaplasmataceae bacterium AB001_6]|nr:phosphoglycerate kinase [Anaplasmataceae bacterium AB001_6]